MGIAYQPYGYPIDTLYLTLVYRKDTRVENRLTDALFNQCTVFIVGFK